MSRTSAKAIAFLAAASLAVAIAPAPQAARAEVLQKEPAWRRPDAADVRSRALAWLAEQKADDAARASASEIWSSASDELSGEEVLTRLVATFALADQSARSLVEICRKPPVQSAKPWRADPQMSPFVAGNLRLFYARWLVHESLFDEALAQLADIEQEAVVDPASLFFYRAVVHHRLLDRQASLEAIGRLLDGAQLSPKRYVAVAGLMREDIKGLKKDTLDHIARRMDDISRRLGLGRAGERVLQIEQGVIDSLDKMIKRLEEQRRKQQQQAGAAGSLRPSSPAPESRISSGKGPGEVTKRNIGNKSGWGDLPPRQRDKVLQQIGREFPSHYRDVIEQYFRKLASDDEK